MVPFWIAVIIRHLIFRVPKKRDHNFDNHPYRVTNMELRKGPFVDYCSTEEGFPGCHVRLGKVCNASALLLGYEKIQNHSSRQTNKLLQRRGSMKTSHPYCWHATLGSPYTYVPRFFCSVGIWETLNSKP